MKQKTGAPMSSDSEQSVNPPKQSTGVVLKRRAVISDDGESDEPTPYKGKDRPHLRRTAKK